MQNSYFYLHLHNYIPRSSCVLYSVLWLHIRALLNISPYITLCPRSHAESGMFTIQSVHSVWLLPHRSHRQGHLILYSDAWLMQMRWSKKKKKKISNDCLLCLCVAMTVKPLFDHSPWILLSQSYTSTPTVRNICCYLKRKSPPIYTGFKWAAN